MVRVIHMLIPSADSLVPVCGAPADEACSTVQEVATCGPCRDIVRARLAFLHQAMGEPEAAPAPPEADAAREERGIAGPVTKA